jgi:hypothetical protein
MFGLFAFARPFAYAMACGVFVSQIVCACLCTTGRFHMFQGHHCGKLRLLAECIRHQHEPILKKVSETAVCPLVSIPPSLQNRHLTFFNHASSFLKAVHNETGREFLRPKI